MESWSSPTVDMVTILNDESGPTSTIVRGSQRQMRASARNECRMQILCFVNAALLHLALFFVFSSKSEAISRCALIMREFLAIQILNWITIK